MSTFDNEMAWSRIWKNDKLSLVDASVKPCTSEAGFWRRGECSESNSHCQVVIFRGISNEGWRDLYVGIVMFVVYQLLCEVAKGEQEIRGKEALKDIRKTAKTERI